MRRDTYKVKFVGSSGWPTGAKIFFFIFGMDCLDCFMLYKKAWRRYALSEFNTLRPRQHGRHFPDDIFKCIFLNENLRILIKISLKFVPKGPIDNIPALAQVMAWRQPGDKPLSDPMMVKLPTHICVTRPQWVKVLDCGIFANSTPSQYLNHWSHCNKLQ